MAFAGDDETGLCAEPWSRQIEPRPARPDADEGATMAHAGQVIENPVTGERITFRQTAADTEGELLAIDLELPPGGHVPAVHVHPNQEERFEVLSGTMRLKHGWRRITAEAGEVVTVAPGVRHDFGNAGEERAVVRVEIRPALQMERLFETAVALARDGRTLSNGVPKPLDLALFVREFEQETRTAFPPHPVVLATLAPLAWLAKRRGFAGRYSLEPAVA
jgi:quercetin dioxygenase-like cupin family protein